MFVVFVFVILIMFGLNNLMLMVLGVNFGMWCMLLYMLGVIFGFGVMVGLLGFGFDWIIV